MLILAFDPGRTTGWAYLENTKRLKAGTVTDSYDRFEDWLIQFCQDNPVDVLVVEDFVFRPGHREGLWKKTDDSKIIGAIKMMAKLRKIPCVEQQPSIKPIGYGMAGMKYVKGAKGTHTKDAIAHGIYYWFKTGRAKELSKSK